MPELPEVEGVVRELVPTVEGKTIERVKLSDTIFTSWEQGSNVLLKTWIPIYLKK